MVAMETGAVVLAGDPWSGFQVFGPFDSELEATEYAEDKLTHKEFWWVMKTEREV
jgi:hypothetical protein